MKVPKTINVRESSHKKHKSKNSKNRILRFIKTLLVMALFITTIIYASLSPLFDVKKIVVTASLHYDSEALVKASGIQKGANGFRQLFQEKGKFYALRIGFAEKAIMRECPYVKSVIVRFAIPSTVAIETIERTAYAVIEINGTSLLVDKDGYLLEIDPVLGEIELPVIKGVEIKEYRPGEKLRLQDDLLLSAFKVFDTIKEVDRNSTFKLMPSVDYVDIGDVYNIGISLQSRIYVNLGEPEDLNYKINTVQTIFSKNIKKNDRGKLDFSIDENPVFIPESGG